MDAQQVVIEHVPLVVVTASITAGFCGASVAAMDEKVSMRGAFFYQATACVFSAPMPLVMFYIFKIEAWNGVIASFGIGLLIFPVVVQWRKLRTFFAAISFIRFLLIFPVVVQWRKLRTFFAAISFIRFLQRHFGLESFKPEKQKPSTEEKSPPID